jgi:hypothetical protein
MNDCNGHEGLLLIIGELLYKNQLLREAIASKDEALALIHLHFMKAATSNCSCGIGFMTQMVGNDAEPLLGWLSQKRSETWNSTTRHRPPRATKERT